MKWCFGDQIIEHILAVGLFMTVISNVIDRDSVKEVMHAYGVNFTPYQASFSELCKISILLTQKHLSLLINKVECVVSHVLKSVSLKQGSAVLYVHSWGVDCCALGRAKLFCAGL